MKKRSKQSFVFYRHHAQRMKARYESENDQWGDHKPEITGPILRQESCSEHWPSMIWERGQKKEHIDSNTFSQAGLRARIVLQQERVKPSSSCMCVRFECKLDHAGQSVFT